MDTLNIPIDAVIEAAHAGGKIVRDYFGQTLEIEEKSQASDFRTRADTEAEEAILEVIQKAFPAFNVFSEEIGRIDNHSEYSFVIDPLDGSNNFVLGVPNFTVSIALMKNNETIVAVTYHPILGTTFHAEQGKGAFLDDVRVHVNAESDITRSTVSYSCGYANSAEYAEQLTHRLNQLGVKRKIEFWSPAYEYCLLAAGKIEAIINNKNELYDYAAGKLLVREAGGKFTTLEGKPDTDSNDAFVASNGTSVHDVLLSVV